MVRRLALSMICIAAVIGCDDDAPLFGSSNEPGVYIVMSQRDFVSATDSTLYGLVVTSGGPFSTQYLSPSAVTVTRQSDNAVLYLAVLGHAGPIPTEFGNTFVRDSGNITLAWTGSGGEIGRGQLVGGDVLQLAMTAGGRAITGRARIPMTPSITLVQDADSVTVHWPRDPGTARYDIFSDTDAGFGMTTTDTVVRLRLDRPVALRPSPLRVRVYAYDSSMVQHLDGSNAASAGLAGAYGVFGAMSADSAIVPDAWMPSLQSSMLTAKRTLSGKSRTSRER
jgi:hypothetical protein